MTEPTKEAICKLQEALKADPAAGHLLFKSSSTLTNGLCAKSVFPNTPQHGEYTLDEPETFPGGKNSGVNPLDLFLGALSACTAISYKAFGVFLGIDVKSVECSVSGEVDLRGFLGVDSAVPCGFQKIFGTVKIDAPDATAEQLEQLQGIVDSHCPMLDLTTGACPDPYESTIEIVAPEENAARDDNTLSADAIAKVGAAFGAEPALAKACYKAVAKLEQGFVTQVSFPNTPEHGPFTLDEPEALPGGQNKGPNPMDVFLAALTSCQNITYKAYGVAMGIDIAKVETAVEGNLDLSGFLCVNEAARKGFHGLRLKVKISTTADNASVTKLKEVVESHCPLVATLKCVEVKPDLKLVKA